MIKTVTDFASQTYSEEKQTTAPELSQKNIVIKKKKSTWL